MSAQHRSRAPTPGASYTNAAKLAFLEPACETSSKKRTNLPSFVTYLCNRLPLVSCRWRPQNGNVTSLVNHQHLLRTSAFAPPVMGPQRHEDAKLRSAVCCYRRIAVVSRRLLSSNLPSSRIISTCRFLRKAFSSSTLPPHFAAQWNSYTAGKDPSNTPDTDKLAANRTRRSAVAC
jgi:hypothetical protein